MLILPFFRAIDWKHPPFITLAIILINVFVFVVIQSGDGARFEKAAKYYLGSDLPQIEYPLYASYLQQSDQNDRYKELFTVESEEHAQEQDQKIYFALETDDGFQKLLRTGDVINENNNDYATWKAQREQYTQYTDAIATSYYSFSPAEPRAVSLFTHMFLHGGIMHLFGNMVVLFIVGFTVEIILGWRMYSLAYVIGGFCAVGFYWLIHPDSQGMLGASGAISGVMGMYAALFGLRKINFFYFVFVYMGVFRAPALLVLVIWLLNEFLQFYTAPESRIAYMAHFGGLLGGAVIGFANRYFNKSIDLDYMEKPQQQEQQAAEYERGVGLMRSMKFEPARRVFRQLLKDNPTDLEVLPHMYTVSKTVPESEDYHQTASTILQICIDSNQGHSLANQVFNDYIRLAKPGPRLNAQTCLKLASRFTSAGFMDTVEKIIRILLPKAAQIPGLASLFSQVGYAYEQQKNADKAKQYYKMVLTYFPKSDEANRIVKKNKV